MKRPTLTQINTLRQWQVLALAMAAFIFNTTEFVPIALLSDIGADLDKSVQEVGIMMTVYAWIVALLSLPAMLATAQVERKKLLMALFVVFIISHIATVLASSFEVLLMARAGVAVAHAIFWSITASLVVRVAPKNKKTAALGILATGSALATVLGLPLGRLLGQYLGWRSTFGTIGLLALFCMVVLWLVLPRLPSKNAGDFKSVPAVLGNKTLVGIYAMTALMVTAHFSAYSYIEPFITTINRLDADFATVVLLIFGLSGIIASFLFGKFYDRFENGFLASALLGLTLSLVVMGLMPDSTGYWLILASTWGISITAVSLTLQLRTLKASAKATDVAMSLFSGIYNIGIGGGALLGNMVIVRLGLPMVGYAGAMVCLLAILVFAGSLSVKKSS